MLIKELLHLCTATQCCPLNAYISVDRCTQTENLQVKIFVIILVQRFNHPHARKQCRRIIFVCSHWSFVSLPPLIFLSHSFPPSNGLFSPSCFSRVRGNSVWAHSGPKANLLQSGVYQEFNPSTYCIYHQQLKECYKIFNNMVKDTSGTNSYFSQCHPNSCFIPNRNIFSAAPTAVLMFQLKSTTILQTERTRAYRPI